MLESRDILADRFMIWFRSIMPNDVFNVQCYGDVDGNTVSIFGGSVSVEWD